MSFYLRVSLPASAAYKDKSLSDKDGEPSSVLGPAPVPPSVSVLVPRRSGVYVSYSA